MVKVIDPAVVEVLVTAERESPYPLHLLLQPNRSQESKGVPIEDLGFHYSDFLDHNFFTDEKNQVECLSTRETDFSTPS